MEVVITAKPIYIERFNLCLPSMYDGCSKAREVEKLFVSWELYFRLQNAPEKSQLLVISLSLERET